jgi:hypothetical protein
MRSAAVRPGSLGSTNQLNAQKVVTAIIADHRLEVEAPEEVPDPAETDIAA